MPRTALSLLVSTCLAANSITADDESALRASEVGVCQEIVNFECRGIDRSFGPDVENLVFFTRIEGATGDAFVSHVWSFEGKEVRRVRLPIRNSSYRTWSMKRVKGLPGRWRAEVLDPIGRSLGTVEFVVAPPREAG